jgi:hypothetical protein
MLTVVMEKRVLFEKEGAHRQPEVAWPRPGIHGTTACIQNSERALDAIHGTARRFRPYSHLMSHLTSRWIALTLSRAPARANHSSK